MNRDIAKKVADAVLYEGYMLYPYRPSAIKNHQRWTFGILYPPAYAEVQQGTERAGMHSECLVKASSHGSVHIQLRFLHLLARQVARAVEDRPRPEARILGARGPGQVAERLHMLVARNHVDPIPHLQPPDEGETMAPSSPPLTPSRPPTPLPRSARAPSSNAVAEFA